MPVWHTLKGHNADAFQDLIKAYNRSQSDIKAVARAFDTPEALDQALGSAAQSKTLPALAQIGDSHTLEDIAQRSYVQPFHALQKAPGLKNTRWFVSADNAFIHDAKGQLMAFPYMLEIPVMYYNQDAFKKAGLVPPEPQRTWMEMQAQLVTMANNGSRKCPLTSEPPGVDQPGKPGSGQQSALCQRRQRPEGQGTAELFLRRHLCAPPGLDGQLGARRDHGAPGSACTPSNGLPKANAP